jgi:hypothetical protein
MLTNNAGQAGEPVRMPPDSAFTTPLAFVADRLGCRSAREIAR